MEKIKISLIQNQKGIAAIYITFLVLTVVFTIAVSISILTYNEQKITRNIVKSMKITRKTISEVEEEIKIPQFMTLSKLDWDNNEIHAGIIKDPTAKGGLRYQVIEPVLSERDKKAF